MTLKEFFTTNQRNAWLNHPNFHSLYVRRSYRAVNSEVVPCFDIASIEALNPGEGAFQRLLEEIEQFWEGPIYVESIFNKDFEEHLLKIGFQYDTAIFQPPCMIRA